MEKVKLDYLDRLIIEWLKKGRGITTLNKSISKKLKKKYGRYGIEKRTQELIKDGIILEASVVVNPTKVFNCLTIVLGEVESVMPKTQAEKIYGLSKIIDCIQGSFVDFKIILFFVTEVGNYDFGIILGFQNVQRYEKFIEEIEKIKIFKRISHSVISDSGSFMFNPTALP